MPASRMDQIHVFGPSVHRTEAHEHVIAPAECRLFGTPLLLTPSATSPGQVRSACRQSDQHPGIAVRRELAGIGARETARGTPAVAYTPRTQA